MKKESKKKSPWYYWAIFPALVIGSLIPPIVYWFIRKKKK